MAVRQFDTFGYRGDLDEEWGEMVRDPTWEQAEAAIRRLDAGEYAGVVMHLKERLEHEPATEYLSVTGGPDGYILCYHVGGRHLHYVAPETTDPGEDVGVVRRDQGVWVPACHVCHDVGLVVEAAQWFFRTAEPHPEVSWGEFGRAIKR
jgi:hypothetical protein